MDDEEDVRERTQDEGQPESAEPDAAESLSEKVPEEISGEGATPLGGTDEHSDAPGPYGTGPLKPGQEK